MEQCGLTSQEVKRRLTAEGFNELPSAGKRPIGKIIWSVATEPMFSLLLGAGLIYFLIGDLKEAAVLSLFALLSVVIAAVQEWRSERVLEALRDLTSPRALVIRDGKPQRIAGKDVVRGDLLILSEGDRIPADAVLVSDDMIHVDESLLTGESVPVSKLQKEDSSLFAGTLLVRGSASAVVTATGIRSEIGKLGQQLYDIEVEPPRLQQQIKRIVKLFALFGSVLCVVSVILYGLLRHNWLEGILSGIALGMALLPEEFPLVLTVFMVMGAWRISKARVLTRKASAIETLGSATVLCTDKTGTLTQNKMSIVFLKANEIDWSAAEGQAPPPEILRLFKGGLKACKKGSYDPMDLAFINHPLVEKGDVKLPEFQYGLKPDLLMMANVYSEENGFNVFAKGAPETIAKACRFTVEQFEDLKRDIEKLAGQGMRVLAAAEASFPKQKELPANADGFEYCFLGLIGFADPLHENVPAAVAECRTAGIRIVMITGDYPATACAIACQAGIDTDRVISGEQLKAMTDQELHDSVRTTNIFARITPDQKLRIVNALKDNGEIVAMTGDGVNDAPSLKAAHIGVAMGGRGTDVAREASSVVLLDDNFGSLVHTIALGRRIHDNLRKAMIYITAIHVPIAGLALLPLIFGMPLILTPLLIALMEMVIDPACSIVLEAEGAEKNVMKRPPRDPKSPLLSSVVLMWGVFQGTVALALLAAVWYFAFRYTLPEDEIRSLVFVCLFVTSIALILVNRSFSPSLLQAFRRKNPFLLWGACGISVIFWSFIHFPATKKLFSLGTLHGHDIFFAVIAGLVILLILELAKFFIQKKIIQ
jgi:Ca2+-transporting ATPase